MVGDISTCTLEDTDHMFKSGLYSTSGSAIAQRQLA